MVKSWYLYIWKLKNKIIIKVAIFYGLIKLISQVDNLIGSTNNK
jgi:hypothetical protein